MSGKLLVLKPNGERQEIDHPGPGMISLQALQSAVGGYIERVRVRLDDREYSAYVDEDGRRKDLTPNVFGTLRLAAPFNPSSDRHQLVGTVAVWMPDTRNIDRIAKDVLLMLVNEMAAHGFDVVKIAPSGHEEFPDWKTCPVIQEADLIQQAFSNDQIVVYFRHPSMTTAPSVILLMLDNGAEMIIDASSPSNDVFFHVLDKIREDIFREFED